MPKQITLDGKEIDDGILSVRVNEYLSIDCSNHFILFDFLNTDSIELTDEDIDPLQYLKNLSKACDALIVNLEKDDDRFESEAIESEEVPLSI